MPHACPSAGTFLLLRRSTSACGPLYSVIGIGRGSINRKRQVELLLLRDTCIACETQTISVRPFRWLTLESRSALCRRPATDPRLEKNGPTEGPHWTVFSKKVYIFRAAPALGWATSRRTHFLAGALHTTVAHASPPQGNLVPGAAHTVAKRTTKLASPVAVAAAQNGVTCGDAGSGGGAAATARCGPGSALPQSAVDARLEVLEILRREEVGHVLVTAQWLAQTTSRPRVSACWP